MFQRLKRYKIEEKKEQDGVIQVKAAIFDMDGLMIDSESVFVWGFAQAGQDLGYKNIETVCKKTIGVTSAMTKEIFLQYYGTDFDYEGLQRLGRKYIGSYYEKNGVPIKEGLFSLLEFLKTSHFKLAVATSTRQESAEKTLFQKTRIGFYFDAVVYGDMLARSKPAPDIYLTAAQRIDIEPSRCYAFEDSINGVKSAYTAGMKVIMVPDLIPPTDEIRPMLYECCSSLTEAEKILRNDFMEAGNI